MTYLRTYGKSSHELHAISTTILITWNSTSPHDSHIHREKHVHLQTKRQRQAEVYYKVRAAAAAAAAAALAPPLTAHRYWLCCHVRALRVHICTRMLLPCGCSPVPQIHQQRIATLREREQVRDQVQQLETSRTRYVAMLHWYAICHGDVQAPVTCPPRHPSCAYFPCRCPQTPRRLASAMASGSS